MNEYMVVIERGKDCWGAYVPDLPGCTSAGDTREEAQANIREAMALWLEEALKDGEEVPAPTSFPFITTPLELSPA